MAMYSTSDFRKWGQLEAMRIILAFPLRRDFNECLYPKIALPDFITSFRRLLTESCCFFYASRKHEKRLDEIFFSNLAETLIKDVHSSLLRVRRHTTIIQGRFVLVWKCRMTTISGGQHSSDAPSGVINVPLFWKPSCLFCVVL